MIKIEVTKSSDHYIPGVYEYEFDQIHIGRSKKNDLIFVDPELPLRYILFSILKDNHGQYLIAKSVGDQSYFFLNGKKVKGSLRLRAQDLISFGKHEIKILDFSKTDTETNLSEEMETFLKQSSDLKFVLDFIEEKIIQSEKQ